MQTHTLSFILSLQYVKIELEGFLLFCIEIAGMDLLEGNFMWGSVWPLALAKWSAGVAIFDDKA